MHTSTQWYFSRPDIDKGNFLAKVYGLLTLSLLLTGGVSYALCTSATQEMVNGVLVPTGVANAIAHPWLVSLSFLGSVIISALVRKTPGINILMLGIISTLSGLLIAPAIYMAQMKANAGHAITTQPVLYAFVLSTIEFVALSLYALFSGRDFSAWHGFLYSGLIVLIGAGILNIFVGGEVLALALSSVAVILFGGYVLHDTSDMLRKTGDDVVGATIQLYLDFLNLFVNLLRILSASKD